MFYTILGIFVRIFSNSYLNVFQKILTIKGEKSSVVNMYTYIGLSLLGIPFLKCFPLDIFPLILIMGILGATGNYFIIKALSIGELSTLAPINSYKPVIALVFSAFLLHETPKISDIIAISFIIFGTYFVLDTKSKNINTKAVCYRVIALICSGCEAVFIKRIVIEVGSFNGLILWAIAGFIFSAMFVAVSRHKPIIKEYKYQLYLIATVGIMQYSTNFVFARMNVAHALALFQLSTLLSIFLGVNIFKETGLIKKLIGATIMVIGAVILLLN